MKTLCIMDFDETLISVDSFKYIMNHEGWLFRPDIAYMLAEIVLCRVFRRDILKARSKLKFRLLCLWNSLSKEKKDKIVEHFKSCLNINLIDAIKEKKYDRLIVVSASEEKLIEKVMDGCLEEYEIIANSCLKNGIKDLNHSRSDDFVTCYGKVKVDRIKEKIPDMSDYYVSVYTDSFSDRPLIDISQEAYMINAKNNSIKRIR